jgi:sugar phosphate isomerase/epimerase
VKTEFYKTLWGMGGTLDEKLTKIKAAGFEGFEDPIQPHFQVKPAIEKSGLKYIGMAFGSDPEQFKKDLGEAFDSGATSVTVHIGGCHFSEQQAMDTLGKFLEHTKQVPFPVNFETHRGRLLYEPLSTARYLKAFPDLYLCADLSHWTVVTESLLHNFKDELELAISRTRHIHARVGHEEGPQVPDPRAESWLGHVKAHEEWWDRIRAAQKARGQEVCTVDPEFGPPNYQWTNPKDGTPLADVFEVSVWMRDRLRDRWKSKE